MKPSPTHTGDDLLGRAAERTLLDGLLTAARAGSGGAVLIHGEPGIGKTALLRYAVRAGAGMTLVGGAGLGAVPDLARRRPVLVVVDDAHLLQPSSVAVLRRVAGRVAAWPVALVLAAATPDALSGLPARRLRVCGLDPEAARDLFGSRGDGVPPAPRVADALLLGTRGHPLALRELTALLPDEQWSGRDPLPDPLPAGPGLRHAYRRRLQGLPESCRVALAVAATSVRPDQEHVVGALHALGVDREHLRDAEERGLIRVMAGRVEFDHPVTRSVVYHTAPALLRRTAHRALAGVIDEPHLEELRVWHLAAAATGPDQATTRLLDQVAEAARHRGERSAAARAMSQAARLTADPEERARRLLLAARDAVSAGRVPAALLWLAQASAETASPALRGEIDVERGRVELWQGNPTAAYEALIRSTRGAPGRAEAAVRRSGAATAAVLAGWLELADRDARAALVLAERSGEPAALFATRVALAHLLLRRGAPAEAAALIAALNADRPPDPAPPELLTLLGVGEIWLGDFSAARGHLTAAVALDWSGEGARPLGWCLAGLAELELWTGDWPRADAHAAEAARIASDLGQSMALAQALAVSARLQALRGRRDGHAHLLRRLPHERSWPDRARVQLPAAAGLLHLGLGEHPEAVRHLLEADAAATTARMAPDAAVPYRGDLIEALARSGQLMAARDRLDRLEAALTAPDPPWPRGVAARCRGMLADGDEIDRHFAEAASLHPPSMPFEFARTQLGWGEALRRARRRTDARGPLRAALNAFTAVGAEPWTARAAAELAATGETVPPAPPPKLTHQERAVASAVFRGLSNPEAATALFLSRKTVEAHLSHIYQKLAVRSRTQLVRYLAANPTDLDGR